MTPDREEIGRVEEQPRPNGYRIALGDQACPRCQKFFTMSYWSAETLVQARCLSCDLKWPRPDVV